MAINALKKKTARGNGPPTIEASNRGGGEEVSAESKEKESELAAQEIEAMWESQEVGITRWSESDGQRYAD
ncbi:MAG: hypothetical protein MRJ96_15345 [Nitrospirales bacterium]|nr:hypothetical protein [Nitrospira sp.]MDR4502818.1 hypothetical protein [Nitrospirales bacterium]